MKHVPNPHPVPGRRALQKRRRVLSTAVAIAVGALSTSAFAVDNVWTGAVDNNYNNPGNWSLGRVPTKTNGQPAPDDFDDAVLNTSTGNVPAITQDFAAIPRDIIVGTGPGVTGIVNHSAGTATTGDGNWMFVGRNGGTGTYNLTGSGSINARGRIYVAGHDGAAATGTFNISTTGTVAAANDLNLGAAGGTGTVNLTAGTVTVGGWLSVGRDENGLNGTGNFNQSGGSITVSGNSIVALPGTRGNLMQTGGTHTVNGELWVGQGAGAVGVATVNAGTVTVNNWIAVGREGATGTLNVGGTGTVSEVGPGDTHITIGTGAGGTGTVNVSGGTLSTNANLIVSENNATARGTVNQTGGLVSVGGNLEVQRQGTGTYNLSGGTLSVNGFIDTADGTFNFTGGKITRGSAGTTTFNGGLTTGGKDATLDAGTGKTFDVNGVLNVVAGNTFGLTGRTIPAAAGTGSFDLGTVDSIVGTFDPTLTGITGLNNPAGATFISESQGEGRLFPTSQSVFWIQEAGGAVSLQYSVVPEPGSVTLLALSGVGLLARRRRKA